MFLRNMIRKKKANSTEFSIDVGAGLQKSWDDTMSEAEEYMAEHADDSREALEEYTN